MNRATKKLLVSMMTVVHLVSVTGCGVVARRPVTDAPPAGELVTSETIVSKEPIPAPTSEAVAPVEKPVGAARSHDPAIQQEAIPERLPPASAPPKAVLPWDKTSRTTTADYRIGEEDELAISVYGNDDLAKTQLVRPGGKIAFPLVGEVPAMGLTPGELGDEIAQRLTAFIKRPSVTVIISKYNSKKVSVLGEVKTPGLLRLGSDIDLLEAIARAEGLTAHADLQGALLIRDGQPMPVDFVKVFKQGDFSQNVMLQAGDRILIPHVNARKAMVLGQVKTPMVVPLTPDITLVESISLAGGLTDDADLQGALLIRDGQLQPVSFDKLFRRGDLSHNALLRPNDIILIPNVQEKKVFVLGEVHKPAALVLKPGVTLVEAISQAGGFTKDAKTGNVVVVRGGLGDPRLLTVDVAEFVATGGPPNEPLEPGDVVYVPRSILSDVIRVLEVVSSVLTPVVLAMSGIVLWPAVRSTLKGERTGVQTNVVVPTQ